MSKIFNIIEEQNIPFNEGNITIICSQCSKIINNLINKIHEGTMINNDDVCLMTENTKKYFLNLRGHEHMDFKYCCCCDREICRYEDCDVQVQSEDETSFCNAHMCSKGWCCGSLKLKFNKKYQMFPLEKKQKYNENFCERHQ